MLKNIDQNGILRITQGDYRKAGKKQQRNKNQNEQKTKKLYGRQTKYYLLY